MEQLIFYLVIIPLDRIDTTFCFSTCMWGQLKCIVQYCTNHLSFHVEINIRCCQFAHFIHTYYEVKL